MVAFQRNSDDEYNPQVQITLPWPARSAEEDAHTFAYSLRC